MRTLTLLAVVIFSVANSYGADKFEDYEKVVKDTHISSLALRQKVLRDTVAKDTYWIKGNWGETIWCLAALYLDEKTDMANQKLLENANEFLDAVKELKVDFKPETSKDLPWPWAYFALGDYTRILCMFGADSTHFPGRLKSDTEVAMKEALWLLVKSKSKVKEAELKYLLVHHGTENHDLTLRPNYYLAASLFKDDPAFRKRKYDDGKTAADHYAAYNTYFRAWARQRVMVGMWFEMGSDTYQKYSWPALFNLHELSPDTMVRKHFGMLLDIAFVEEAQVSVRGRRGGGRSRAGYGKNPFEGYKNLFYAPKGGAGGCSHSKVMETSNYQLPPAAIVLRKMVFPTEKIITISNRVPGEMSVNGIGNGYSAYVADSALINYSHRTPNYILGSTLQNPALSMKQDGKDILKYSGISRQNRWSGILFDNKESRFPVVSALKQRADNEMCAIFVEVEKTRGGRPQHPHWSFQHENVLFLQRITPNRNGMGSYSTGRMNIRFHGKGLKKTEKEGWIFVTNGKAFAGVKFLDGPHIWDEAGEVASSADHKADATTRILLHAGDATNDLSYEVFCTTLLKSSLKVEKDRIEYKPTKKGPVLECFRYRVKDFKKFKLPQVDDRPIDLRPKWTYRSPYLNGIFGEDKVRVTVGPIKREYNFGE